MKTTIAIPCVVKHLGNLDKMLTSFVNGTILPDEVVIATFPILKKEQYEMIDYLIGKFGKYFELDIISLKEHLPRPEARNFLIPFLFQNDLILWHDADDTQHPQRIEIVKQFFEKYDIVHLCHAYRKGREKEIGHIDFNNIRYVFSEQMLQFYNKKFLSYDAIDWQTFAFGGGFDMPICGGVCCIRKEVLEKIKFTRKYPGEDSKFCYDILREFKKTILIDAKIYNYNIV